MKQVFFFLFLSLIFNQVYGQSFTEVIGTPFVNVVQSSISFADIDGDTDQDVLITGRSSLTQQISKLYTNNGNGMFTEVAGTPFANVGYSSIAFADVDGDTDIDVLITGQDSSNQRISKLYTNDGNGIFMEVIGTPFENVTNSSVAFADIDNDMDMDVLITGIGAFGNPKAILYTNDGNGVFTEVVGTPFEGVHSSSIAFADIDNDTDMDVLITGFSSLTLPIISKLYTNDGSGTFTEVTGTIFEGVHQSSTAFADIDGDTDIDVLITGQNSSGLSSSKLYTNNGSGVFTEVIGVPFENVFASSVAFADVDGDADLDVLITGQNSPNFDQPVSKLYTNNGNGIFTEITGTPFENVFGSSIAFADIDNDTDMDILITGVNSSNQLLSKLYENNTINVNTESQITEYNIQIYPNPVQKELVISNIKGIKTIIIYNSLGQFMKQLMIRNDQLLLDVSTFPKGTYVLQFQKENGYVLNKQFIKF